METVIPEGSPLAVYLEGKGEAASEEASLPSNRSSQSFFSFAPLGYPKRLSLPPRPDVRLPQLRSGHLNILRRAYAAAVSSTLGRSDNEHFLEHFRYIIIGSQLLNDHSSSNSVHLPNALQASQDTNYSHNAITITGAISSALLAFSFSWILSWATDTASGIKTGRLTLLCFLTALLVAFLVAYARRQWLQYLRRQAIETAVGFIAKVQTFDAAQYSTVTLIQEVELVSRGYKISNPLPPASRIEGQNQTRRCPRLRRNLQNCYATLIPAMIDAANSLKESVDQDDLDKFLDIYDIREADLEEAFLGYTLDVEDDNESLKQLRIHQHRYQTLRRVLMCSLLAVPATGQKADALRWRTAMEAMEKIKDLTCNFGDSLNKVLSEDERQSVQSPTNPTSPIRTQQTPVHARVRSQLRRVSALSTGIRSLQAKLYLLREDSQRALSTSTSEDGLEDVSNSLREQYAALGSDLKALMQAWEADKNALDQDITRQRRRVSRPNSLSDEAVGRLRPSIGRLLSSVDEDCPSTPSQLTPALGDVQLPLSPPATEDGSDEPRTDDEVFEAIASPKIRQKSSLSREQRILKMHEDREKAAQQKERREANTHMLRELQSVIKLRPAVGAKTPHERVTSV